jgi:hypothetical protein
MLFSETVAVYCKNYMKHTNTLCGQNAEFYYLKKVVHIATIGFYRVKSSSIIMKSTYNTMKIYHSC